MAHAAGVRAVENIKGSKKRRRGEREVIMMNEAGSKGGHSWTQENPFWCISGLQTAFLTYNTKLKTLRWSETNIYKHSAQLQA